jgi:hypothetical protein
MDGRREGGREGGRGTESDRGDTAASPSPGPREVLDLQQPRHEARHKRVNKAVQRSVQGIDKCNGIVVQRDAGQASVGKKERRSDPAPAICFPPPLPSPLASLT